MSCSSSLPAHASSSSQKFSLCFTLLPFDLPLPYSSLLLLACHISRTVNLIVRLHPIFFSPSHVYSSFTSPSWSPETMRPWDHVNLGLHFTHHLDGYIAVSRYYSVRSQSDLVKGWCLEHALNNRDILGPLDRICQPTCSHATYTIVGSSYVCTVHMTNLAFNQSPFLQRLILIYASFRWTRILHTTQLLIRQSFISIGASSLLPLIAILRSEIWGLSALFLGSTPSHAAWAFVLFRCYTQG